MRVNIENVLRVSCDLIQLLWSDPCNKLKQNKRNLLQYRLQLFSSGRSSKVGRNDHLHYIYRLGQCSWDSFLQFHSLCTICCICRGNIAIIRKTIAAASTHAVYYMESWRVSCTSQYSFCWIRIVYCASFYWQWFASTFGLPAIPIKQEEVCQWSIETHFATTNIEIDGNTRYTGSPIQQLQSGFYLYSED